MLDKLRYFYQQYKLRKSNDNSEQEYYEFKKQEIQQKASVSLKVITLVAIGLFFAERDLETFWFALYSPIIYLVNKSYPSFSIYFDLIMNVIVALSFSSTQITLDSQEFQPHIRAYIYVASLFCISINTSMNWCNSTIAFGLSNFMVAYRSHKHFKHIPSNYIPVIVSTVATFGVSLYWVEQYQRKIYQMYQNVKKLKKKQAIILNHYPESLVIVNLKKKQLKYFNQSFASMFNYNGNKNFMISPNSLIGKVGELVNRIKVYYIDQGNQIAKTELFEIHSIWDIIEIMNKCTSKSNIHIRILKNDESENQQVQQQKQKTYYEVSTKIIEDNKDTYMIIFKNITKLKEYEKNKKFTKISKIAYYQVTHEIMTPINTLISMIQLLRQKLCHSDQDLKEIIELCYNTTNKILRTVNLYTDYQMLQEGLLTKYIQPFNLVKQIQEIYQSYQNETQMKLLTFKLNVDKNLLKSDGIINNDKQRLTQIIQIIIDNAIKFTTYGSIIINVSSLTSTSIPGDLFRKVKIQIIDSGCGIDEAKQEQLFRIFETTKFQKKINDGGAGIGLAFCKKLEKIIQTQISYSSQKGQGTTVTLEIADLNSQNHIAFKKKFDSQQKLSLANENQTNQTQNSIVLSDFFRKSKSISLLPLDDLKHIDSGYESFNDEDLSEENPSIPDTSKYKNSHILPATTFGSYMKDQIFSYDNIARNNLTLDTDPKLQRFSKSQNAIERPNILIVDDEAFSAFSLQQILKQIFNLKSDISYCGKQAIQAIQQRQGYYQYKIVFMDLNMPEINGLETLKILRSQQDENKINIDDTAFILYSCLSNTIDLSELRQEFDDVIQKPIDIKNLRELLIEYHIIR